MVGRAVLTPEDEAASDASDTSEANEGSAAKGALPLASKVVRLIGHGLGDIAVGSCARQEDAKVTNSHALSPAHEGQTDYGQQGVEDDQWSTDVIFVADPGSTEHDQACKGIRRGDLRNTLVWAVCRLY